MSDDASLVRRAQAGDVSGLGELLERHRALLHAVAVGMLGHGSQAEDAVHDTFVIALRRIGDLRDPAAARAWLLAILGNVCRAQLRRAMPEPMADVPEPSAGMPVEAAIDRLVLRDWVWAALDRLSPAAAARGRAALLHRRELVRRDRRPVRRPGRHRPQPAQRRAHPARRRAARDGRRAPPGARARAGGRHRRRHDRAPADRRGERAPRRLPRRPALPYGRPRPAPRPRCLCRSHRARSARTV